MSPRLLPLLISLIALPTFADEAASKPGSGDAATVPLRTANLKEIEQVLPASSRDAGQLNRGITVMAVTYTRRLDRDNPNWGPQNPRWDKIYQQVYADIGHDAQSAMSKYGAQFNHDFAAAVARHVSERDLQTVLAYYRTDEGKRFRRFEDSLDAIVANALIHSLRLVQLGTPPGDEALNKPVPAERAASRRRLLSLAEGFRIIQAKVRAEHDSPEDDTVDQKTLDMFFKLTNLAGAEPLDRLGEDYKDDLDRFATFSHSAPAEALYAGLAGATSEMLPTLGQLQQSLDQSVQQHMDRWKTLYAAP